MAARRPSAPEGKYLQRRPPLQGRYRSRRLRADVPRTRGSCRQGRYDRTLGDPVAAPITVILLLDDRAFRSQLQAECARTAPMDQPLGEAICSMSRSTIFAAARLIVRRGSREDHSRHWFHATETFSPAEQARAPAKSVRDQRCEHGPREFMMGSMLTGLKGQLQ